MKLNHFLLAALLFSGASLTPAAPVCCTVVSSNDAIAQDSHLSGKSIYQLDLKLTDDQGRIYRLPDLQGRAVVLTLFYTQCQYACPKLVDDMLRMQKALPPKIGAKVVFLLVSFDPTHDDTAALQTYREQHGLGSQWTLLRGSPDDIRALAMVLGVQYKPEAGGFAHSNLITLLNKSGEIVHQRAGFQDKIGDTTAEIVAAAR